MAKSLWVEKYRPKTLDEYIFQNESHKTHFLKYVNEDKSIPHLLLKGAKGTGKTSLAYILKEELGVADIDFKVINASDDNSVDVVRTSIKTFAKTMPMGDFKIVFLDEADFLTLNAQASLRRIMEEYSEDVRFILTCNRPHKIMEEIKSRCQEYAFDSFDKVEMRKYAYKVLKAENVNIRSEDDLVLLKQYVDDCFPDMRKLLNTLSNSVIDGVLVDSFYDGDKGQVMVSIIDELNDGDWMTARQHIINSIDNDEWDEIYKFLYDNLDQVKGFDNTTNWKRGIVIIADHLRFHYQVADPEINFSACMIRLSEVIE